MLKVYGHPASQPSRSVIWACVLNNLPFELTAPDPDSDTQMSPRGQIPVIHDGNFILSEMPAILGYLAEKHAWSTMYPSDLQQRAKVAQYLHEHHCLTRLATTKLMAPHILVAFGGVPTSNPLSYVSNFSVQESMADENVLENGQALIAQVIDYLVQAYLAKGDFIAGTSAASIADLACFEEIAQLEHAGLFDFTGNDKMRAWLRRMELLPFHDELHQFNRTLGDIRVEANTMERFTNAVTQAMNALSALPQVHTQT